MISFAVLIYLRFFQWWKLACMSQHGTNSELQCLQNKENFLEGALLWHCCASYMEMKQCHKIDIACSSNPHRYLNSIATNYESSFPKISLLVCGSKHTCQS